MERRFITPEQAISLLKDEEEIHTFRSGGILIGCDWGKNAIIKVLKDHPESIEIGGIQCRKMNHAIVVDYNGLLFIENDEEKLNAFDELTL